MKIAILNCAICTENGVYEMTNISFQEAMDLINDNGQDIISAIGHEGTAQVLSNLFGFEVKLNRIEFKQEANQKAIVFKLNNRIPEGKILNRAEIEEIGYSFKLLERFI